MRVLFIEPYPTEGPSSRYRVEQYVPYLEANGVRCRIRPFASPRFYRILYKKGHFFKKTFFFMEAASRRILDIFSGIRADIIFIHLEAFPLAPPLFEWFFSRIGKKIIYDLDDAIYMEPDNRCNKIIKYLKCPWKIREIIKISDRVIACNEYLAEYARKFNNNVTVIHTSVDTARFAPGPQTEKGKPTIGWIGSHSTAKYLNELKNVFYQLSLRYRFRIKIIGAAGYNFKIPGVTVLNLDWRLKDEIEQFQSLDIGVYPLTVDNWTLGKTGFKTIQYMSIGIPCVVSNVGANQDIVKDGENGFLADSEGEWIEKISRLIEEPALRRRIGLAGRKTVEEKFSLKVNAPRYFAIFKEAAERRGRA